MDPLRKIPESSYTPHFNYDFRGVIKPLLDPSLGRNTEYLTDHYNRVVNIFLESAYKDIKTKAHEKIKLEDPEFTIFYYAKAHFQFDGIAIPNTLLNKINEVFQSWLSKVTFSTWGFNPKDLITSDYILPKERLYVKNVKEWIFTFEYDNPYLFVVPSIPTVLANDDSNLSVLLWKDRTEEESTADIEFEVGQKRFRAHSNVVSVGSRVLKKLCTTPMKERNSPTKKIEVDQPEYFEEFLYLLYHRKLKETPEKRTLANLAEIIKLTDKYDAPDLSSIVLTEILVTYRTMEVTADTFAEIFEATVNLYGFIHMESYVKSIDDFLGKIFKFANLDLKLCENIANRISDAEECKKFKRVAKQTGCQNVVDAIDEMLAKRIFGETEKDGKDRKKVI